SVEYIKLERGGPGAGQMLFVEGAAAHPNTIQFPLAIGFPTVKIDLELVWHQVPTAFVLSTTDFTPVNLLRLLGTVNDFSYRGYPGETLLFVGAELTPIVQPVDPQLTSGLSVVDLPSTVNVKLWFKFWDPPKKQNPDGTYIGVRGHNNA